jgi:hypothetical protein
MRISVFAALGIELEDLLVRRFDSFRTIYLPTAGRLRERGFELLTTGQRPLYTVQLRRADDPELQELLAALGAANPNPQYGTSTIQGERAEMYRSTSPPILRTKTRPDTSGPSWMRLATPRSRQVPW